MEGLLQCKGKNAWPELVGKNGDYAKKVVEKENPHVNAIVLPEGSPVPLDFRCDRVYILLIRRTLWSPFPSFVRLPTIMINNPTVRWE
ncbi:hypothetical protein NMG60_11025493 [Bertholletia excelsa]